MAAFLASMSNTELLEICQKWAQKKQQIFFGFTASWAAGYSVFMLSVKPELEQAFNQLCSDVVLHIRIIIAVHFGEIADIPGISVKDSLYRYGVALMCFYYRVIGEK